MGLVGLEVSLIVLLVIANGVFSMAEMAVVSSRKARLRQRAGAGSRGAVAALGLLDKPHDFLSTVQIGITLVGTLAGAFGGATIAENFAVYLRQFPEIAVYAESIAIGTVVLAISYVTLIVGELVPKNLALSNPEGIAAAVARPMMLLSRLGAPAVRLLTFSTRVVMKLLPVKAAVEEPVTEEEIKVLIAEGTERGTFQEAEQEMVEGVFRLGDRRAVELMTPRGRVAFLDARRSWEENREVVRAHPYSRFPVLGGGPDEILGIVHARDLLLALEPGKAIDLRQLARKPLVLPEQLPALEALDRFQESGDQMALIVDEHASVQGVLTVTDLMEAVVGELRGPGMAPKGAITPREDGSWLADGAATLADLVEELGMREALGRDEGVSTVAGLVLAHLRHIPKAGEHVHLGGWRFEVLDMDGHRIDKVLVTRQAESE